MNVPSEVLRRLNEQELRFYVRIADLGLHPEIEFRFHHARKWRFDIALVDKMIAVEIEGGSWIGGRHSRGPGFRKDCEKYNTATRMGWRVLRYTPDMIDQLQDDVIDLIQPK